MSHLAQSLRREHVEPAAAGDPAKTGVAARRLMEVIGVLIAPEFPLQIPEAAGFLRQVCLLWAPFGYVASGELQVEVGTEGLEAATDHFGEWVAAHLLDEEVLLAALHSRRRHEPDPVPVDPLSLGLPQLEPRRLSATVDLVTLHPTDDGTALYVGVRGQDQETRAVRLQQEVVLGDLRRVAIEDTVLMDLGPYGQQLCIPLVESQPPWRVFVYFTSTLDFRCWMLG